MEGVDDHSDWEQKHGSCCGSACKEFNHSSAACEKHCCHEDVGEAAEDDEDAMGDRSISGFHNFEECVSVGSSPFQLDGERGEENDLNAGTSSIPQCTRNAVPGDTRLATALKPFEVRGDSYLYVTVVLCSSVAAQVHVDTTDDATKPDLRDRPAVVNSSDVCGS